MLDEYPNVTRAILVVFFFIFIAYLQKKWGQKRPGVFAMEFYMRGRHRFSKGDVEGSIEDFSKAIQLAEKRKIKAHYLELRAFAYAEIGKHELAQHDIELAQKYDPLRNETTSAETKASMTAERDAATAANKKDK